MVSVASRQDLVLSIRALLAPGLSERLLHVSRLTAVRPLNVERSRRSCASFVLILHSISHKSRWIALPVQPEIVLYPGVSTLYSIKPLIDYFEWPRIHDSHAVR